MTHFWEPLSDDVGLELFGALWPLDGDPIRLDQILHRVQELGDGATWPAALGALVAIADRTDSDTVVRRCCLEAARITLVWEEPLVAGQARRVVSSRPGALNWFWSGLASASDAEPDQKRCDSSGDLPSGSLSRHRDLTTWGDDEIRMVVAGRRTRGE